MTDFPDSAGIEVPTEWPHCAGRLAVAHDRTLMKPTADGWICPECGEPSES